MCARHGPKPGAQGSPVRTNQRCAAPRAVRQVAAHLRLTAYAAGTISYLFSTGAITCRGRVPPVNLRFLCRLFDGSREKNTRSETEIFSHPPALLDFRGTYTYTIHVQAGRPEILFFTSICHANTDPPVTKIWLWASFGVQITQG